MDPTRDYTVTPKQIQPGPAQERKEKKSTLKIATTVTEDGKRIKKQQVCKYCLDEGATKFTFARLPDHLEAKHEKETDVALMLAATPSRRKLRLESIRNAGSRMLQLKCYKKGEGVVDPKRRPSKEVSTKQYLMCDQCGKLFLKTYLVRHTKYCLVNTKKIAKSLALNPEAEASVESPEKPNYRGLNARAAMLLPPMESKEIDDDFRKEILNNMTYDDVFVEILKDSLILKYGKKTLQDKRNKMSPNAVRVCKDRMRELGRFMLDVKKENPEIQCMVDLFCPTKYNLVIKAAKMTAGYDQQKNNFKCASIIIRLKNSILDCCKIYAGLCYDNLSTHSLVPSMNMFRDRISDGWSSDLSILAHKTLNEARWNKVQRLPLAKDVAALHKHLKLESEVAVKEITQNPNEDNFRKLTELTLCQTMLLNRRRPGEVQFMEIGHYRKALENTDREEEEVLLTLSEMERALVKNLLQIIYIRGKKGRKVPIILTKELQNAIKIVVSLREKVRVPEGNNFLFPALNSHSTGAHRADVVLKKMTKACPGLKDAKSITGTGTQLRKHVATMMQLLNLRENELDAIATFLGHNIDVHRKFYRLQESTVQLAKVSKVLLAIWHTITNHEVF
ncbi:tRNA uridine 5-carboxymethylaminomethyl modification enzyme [Frankliniella fusca]|uniref:tRNA uridine 5-carboxymethylaminomethyl modification enzyme n=1 Tax=Frankliniella fusca TaxID=407009 RepID=A0AAE1LLZ4_9NEOP|nr:tRNA uridine 5-carboxymethylaminomethyl modification enzyme [Frankliniella fusca]